MKISSGKLYSNILKEIRLIVKNEKTNELEFLTTLTNLISTYRTTKNKQTTILDSLNKIINSINKTTTNNQTNKNPETNLNSNQVLNNLLKEINLTVKQEENLEFFKYISELLSIFNNNISKQSIITGTITKMLTDKNNSFNQSNNTNHQQIVTTNLKETNKSLIDPEQENQITTFKEEFKEIDKILNETISKKEEKSKITEEENKELPENNLTEKNTDIYVESFDNSIENEQTKKILSELDLMIEYLDSLDFTSWMKDANVLINDINNKKITRN